ncbi:hypothetical protein IU469_29995 [Nocardia puris]|uniref:hypothetical protein n=1 Tax=Nocardia puris TaxID=208602 RepID=UPI0011BF354A|nr:hypothetical protein [Nocardia puris]MBF6369912.1 hypothetical protein [Nocardia puris]
MALDQRSRSRRRPIREYQLAAVLFAFIVAVVVTVFVIVVRSPGEPSSTPAPSASSSSTPSVTSRVAPFSSTASRPPAVDRYGVRLEDTGADSGVALAQDAAGRVDPADPAYLRAAPTGLQWQRGWDGAALPVSASDGPTRISGGVATGFARTPQGAALAGLDATARALAAPDGEWESVVRQRFYGEPDMVEVLLDRYRLARARTVDAARYVVVPDGVRLMGGYDGELAVVETATRDGAGGYSVSSLAMVWVDGDWRVRIPGVVEQFWAPPRHVMSIEDFGAWKGGPR